MPERPLLIFPQPVVTKRHRGHGGRGSLYTPPPRTQVDRLTPQIRQLEATFAAAREAVLQQNVAGVEPEKVLVLETAGRVDDFVRAVRGVPGLEWLTEWDEDDVPPEDGVFYDIKHPEKPISGRFYLLMSNVDGLRQFQALWREFQRNPDAPAFARGRTLWRDVFKQLREIRAWNSQDRLFETGLLEDWVQRAAAGQERVRVEVELWFREQAQLRQRSSLNLRAVVEELDGRVLAESDIAEISYHAILVELPIEQVRALVQGEETRLAIADQVMFFRPVGQSIVPEPEGESIPQEDPDQQLFVPAGDPIVALFDGLPIENHSWLAGRLQVDDPDGWAANYPAGRRYHGTAMASLIVHGDLESPGLPLPNPLYVRPMLRPDFRDWNESVECIPEDVLPIDLFHRAVLRMVRGEDGEAPVAPSVRIINVSLGDPLRQFSLALSPWARLLDYLSWRYRLLFVVSAGNHDSEIVLDLPREEYDELQKDPGRLEAEVTRAIASDAWNRRLLAPSEAINVLTVGATHEDNSNIPALPVRANPVDSLGLPSPISAMGLGFRRSTKPDLLFPGGRQLYREKPGNMHEHCTLRVDRSTIPPGLKVAAPGRVPGELNATRYSRGTSNATALATRSAAILQGVLNELRAEDRGEQLDNSYTAVVLKTLLVHSASWGTAADQLKRHLGNADSLDVAKLLGYGRADTERVIACTAHRGTLLGVSTISDGQGHLYEVPLPPSLSGRADWRRVTITLAWLTPVNNQHRAYRRAALWCTPYGANSHDGAASELLSVQRTESQWQMVKRGTVQHEIFEGARATGFVDGDVLRIQVNCSADAGRLDEGVPYAMAVTMEVSPQLNIPLYEEIRARIRPRVAVGVGA
jgi:hypothetical protein